MSSIQKLKNKDGKTFYKVSFDLPRYNNQRRKSSHTFKPNTPYAEVKLYALERDREYQNGKALLIEDSNITFKELSEIYLKDFLVGKSPTTIASYESILRNRQPYGVYNVIGNIPITKITLTTLQSYVNLLIASNISNKTIKNTFMVVSSIFKLAIKMGIISKYKCPVEDVVLPKLTPPKTQAYTEQEIKKLLERAKNDSNKYIYLLLLFSFCTGARRSETAGMTFSKIDFKNSKITIDESVVVIHGERYKKPPKTTSSNRTLIAPQILMDELKKSQTEYKLNKLRFGKDFIDSDAIFTHPDGTPYTPSGLSNMYARFLKRNPDIPPKSFHKMRSSFCSILLLNNVDIKTVSAAMGHSQLNITLSRYAKEFEEGKKSAANKLDDIFNSSSESA